MRLLFIGHNGYGYPHTRVRCYHFARMLSGMTDWDVSVLSFRDDLAPHKTEAEIYSLRDREKLVLSVKALRRLLRERKSILYIQKAHFHAAAPYLLHRLGILQNYIFDYDDYDVPLSNFFYRGAWNRLFFGSNRWDEITCRIMRNAKACVAASRELQAFVKEHNPQTTYIPTGVDASIFTPVEKKPGKQDVTFLWNGLVWGEPVLHNLYMMLTAFRHAYTQAPFIRLVLVGGGAMWDTLKTTIQTQYSHLPITLREWVAPQEMPGIVAQADVGLLPMQGNDRWLRCKSPTKLFEYMACGLPVVASAVGEVTHVIRQGESGVLAQNEPEYAQGIVALANSETLRRSMGENARHDVEQGYSLPVLGERLYDFIQSVCG